MMGVNNACFMLKGCTVLGKVILAPSYELDTFIVEGNNFEQGSSYCNYLLLISQNGNQLITGNYFSAPYSTDPAYPIAIINGGSTDHVTTIVNNSFMASGEVPCIQKFGENDIVNVIIKNNKLKTSNASKISIGTGTNQIVADNIQLP